MYVSVHVGQYVFASSLVAQCCAHVNYCVNDAFTGVTEGPSDLDSVVHVFCEPQRFDVYTSFSLGIEGGILALIT